MCVFVCVWVCSPLNFRLSGAAVLSLELKVAQIRQEFDYIELGNRKAC